MLTPDARDPAARTIADERDIEDVVALIRLKYERVLNCPVRTGERQICPIDTMEPCGEAQSTRYRRHWLGVFLLMLT